jgi:hypothetical protein
MGPVSNHLMTTRPIQTAAKKIDNIEGYQPTCHYYDKWGRNMNIHETSTAFKKDNSLSHNSLLYAISIAVCSEQQTAQTTLLSFCYMNTPLKFWDKLQTKKKL